MIKSNRGQLSIFMGITLILVMGMLAFIINVGLFVKAKINLQNAVDAAAFAGAATQARQLSNIAYVNWEMRNTYKEWMFKYYVLGQMGLIKGTNSLSESGLSSNGDRVRFLLATPSVAGTAATVGFDKFNVPSICVHNNSSTDICPIYALPGIPRFPAIGVAGISEIHEAFVNKLVEEKGANCSARTQLNFLASLSWAYSSGIKEIAGAPLIATNRAGAWPEALELAMRMRNLEMIMNRPPVPELSLNNVKNLASEGADIGLNERPIKAFMSAYRNLGGGKYKGASGATDELSASFKLTELAPQTFDAQTNTVSGFLIPDYGYPGGGTARQKHYVDLQIVPVNYATMFTTFATTRNEFEPSVDSEASCFVSKSAMPVPGYILGFVKNPTVMTYYAVKGEADFTGLFFPRVNEGQAASFKLHAYAAAKPFGGRIGPKLFTFLAGESALAPRADNNSKSGPYISGIETDSAFKPGSPIPPSQLFWVNGFTSAVGGIPGSGVDIAYGIPNLIYDVASDSDLTDQNGGGAAGGRIQTVKAQSIANTSTIEDKGLYRTKQFRYLKSALLEDFTGRNMNSDDLMRSLITSRRVTRYDAINYLIPDVNGPNASPVHNAAAIVKKLGVSPGGRGFDYELYAPLVGQNLLYTSESVLTTVVGSYIAANESAINSYLASLLEVGKTIFALPSGVGAATNVNAQAAQSIHANAGGSNVVIPALLVSADENDPSDPNCKKDMASKFNHFFRGKKTQCGIVPLEILMIEYINKKNQGRGGLFYRSTYFNDPGNPVNIMSAYFPGERQGTSNDADASALNPIGARGTATYSTRRNYYSTKFVPLSNLFQSSPYYKNDVLLEAERGSPLDAINIIQQNPLLDDSTTGLNKAYFKDF